MQKMLTLMCIVYTDEANNIQQNYITICMLGNFAFLSSVNLVSKLTFSKHSFRNTIRVSNSLDSG